MTEPQEGFIVVDGVPTYSDAEPFSVFTYVGTPLDFQWQDIGYRREKHHHYQLGVCHWTGGVRAPLGAAATMRTRDVGAHFIINGLTGGLTQFTDPARWCCYHAKLVNRWTWGCEITSPGYPREPHLGDHEWLTPTYEVEWRGKLRTLYRFSPAALTTWAWLAQVMCDVQDVPRRVLVSPRNHADALPSAPQWKPYAGIIGHSQCQGNRIDPGPEPLEYLAQHAGFTTYNRLTDMRPELTP